jgi:ABC-type sugar transport system substrate-binding protein
MAKLCKKPGKIAILVGNHRDPCQEMNEIRFRSCFREPATDFQVLDAITTFEDSKYACQSTLDLLHHTRDLASGGAAWAGSSRSRYGRYLRKAAVAGRDGSGCSFKSGCDIRGSAHLFEPSYRRASSPGGMG